MYKIVNTIGCAKTPLSLLVATAGLVAIAGVAAEAGGGTGVIGFRNDGTGVFPADCAPVTKWNEWDFKKVTVKDAKGRDVSQEVPDKENRVNIVWKVALPSACNGGMILVKGRLYMLVDRGGYAYATEWTPDFVGSRLVCMDPKDGKILWQKDLDHLGELPKEEAEKKGKDVLDFYAWWTKAFGTFNRWHAATRQRSQDRSLDTPERQKEYAEAAKAAQELGIPVPETVEALKVLPFHPLGRGKLARLGRPDPLPGLAAPPAAASAEWVSALRARAPAPAPVRRL